MKKIFTLLLSVCSLSSFAQNISLCFRDFDEDGYGDPNNFVGSGIFCPIGYVSDNTDCDDHDRSIHLLVWYRDFDNDGYGDGTTIESCTQPPGYTDRILPTVLDCNDHDQNIKPITWYVDADHDDYALFMDVYIVSCTPPQDQRFSLPESQLKGLDCNDDNPNIYPQLYYIDADGDGYRALGDPLDLCVPLNPSYRLASEFTSLDIDCDDGDALIGTGPEWYKDEDNDGYTDGTILRSCVQPGGYISDPRRTETNGFLIIDCNDHDPIENPNQSWILDDDLDHYGRGFLGGETIKGGCTRPAGNWFAASELNSEIDCDDGNASVTTRIWVLDADNDGYYTGDPVSQCEFPGAGYVQKDTRSPGDCNDNDRTISPSTIWYKDADGDGYNNSFFITQPSCTPPGPGYVNTTKGPDCDDTDPTLNPETIWFRDADGDGYNNSFFLTQPSCTAPGPGYSRTTKGSDCDDNNPALPATYWYKDADGDGYHDELVASISAPSCTPPTPEYTAITRGPDCNDGDAAINPATIWYLDADGDGYHSPLYIGTPTCTSPGAAFKTTSKGPDCNDNNAAQNPETVWILDADGDGYYNESVTSCIGLAGYKIKSSEQSGDCNDADGTAHTPIRYYLDADHDGYGSAITAMFCSSVAPPGFATNNMDCDDGKSNINPATTWYKDADNDGYSNNTKLVQCARPTGYKLSSELTATSGDCNDNSFAVNPGMAEICSNKIDDNCNGIIDEACVECQTGTGLNTTSITFSSAKLNWTALVTPNAWQVRYKKTSPGGQWTAVDVAGNLNFVNLTSLASNQSYNWQIKAYCGKSWTDFSATVSFITTSANTITQTATRSAVAEITKEKELPSALEVKVLNNPTSGEFTLIAQGSSETSITMRVVDIGGRTIEVKNGIINGHAIRVGGAYKIGAYFAEFSQDRQRKLVKLIKL